MKFNREERARILAWLDKDPSSEDKAKNLEINGRTLSRDTHYFGDNKWKVRIAFDTETWYPVMMSAPIQGGATSKKDNMGQVLVPKLPKKAVKKGEFAKVVDQELKNIYAKHIQDHYTFSGDSVLDKLLLDEESDEYADGPEKVPLSDGMGHIYYVTLGAPYTGLFYKEFLQHHHVPGGFKWTALKHIDAYVLDKV